MPMCCRFYMEMSPELRPIVEAANRSRLYRENIDRLTKPVCAGGEVFPEALVPVLASGRSGAKAVFPMLWGYHVPGIQRPIVNARVETAAEKPSFREGWGMHRCAIPVSWYFEWEHLLSPSGRRSAGDKYAIMTRGASLSYLCGLYRMEEGYPHFVVLTREAADSVRFLHDRMPLMLPEEAVDRWIDPRANPYLLLSAAVDDVVFEKAAL